MPSCDMCGAEGKLVRALIEGTELNVCRECSKFGKVMANPVRFINQRSVVKEEKPEPLEIIVPDYNNIIKTKRESLGLKQEELAKQIAERESTLQKIEAGQMKPSIGLARKLEKFLSIKLVEDYEDGGGALSTKTKTAEFTIGDAIKIRQRKSR